MADSAAGHSRMRNAHEVVHSGFGESMLRFLKRPYVLDYAGAILVLVAYILTQNLIEPFHRMFYLDDIAIQYPYAAVERVPLFWLFAYAGVFPLVVLIVWAVATRPPVHQLHVTIFGFVVCLLLTSFLTDVIKNAVGRPRPDLLARCKPEPGTAEHHLVTYRVCTETKHHLLHDGWRSFPSGHSSFAFGGLGFLALFAAGQFHALRPRADLLRIFFVLAPLLCAGLIAISRCEDYRHDVWDVTAGSALGLVIAFLIYRKSYPPLMSAKCDLPYSIRMQSDPRGDFAKVGDEEERLEGTEPFSAGDPGDDFEAQSLPRGGG